jgi:hypothetical protein
MKKSIMMLRTVMPTPADMGLNPNNKVKCMKRE